MLTSIPSPGEGVWHLGPIPVRAYALAILAGILLAIWMGNRRWVARGGQPGTVADIAVWAVPLRHRRRPRLSRGHRLAARGHRHPTFLYESLWAAGVAIILILVDRRYQLSHSRLFAVYVASSPSDEAGSSHCAAEKRRLDLLEIRDDHVSNVGRRYRLDVAKHDHRRAGGLAVEGRLAKSESCETRTYAHGLRSP